MKALTLTQPWATLEVTEILHPPIEARGALGLWNWERP